jgi:hypothetical protein
MVGFAWWLVPAAMGGSGPWIQSTSDASVYLGTEAQRFGQFITEDGNFSSKSDPIDVDDGISTLYVKAIASYGITPRSEAEIQVPYGYVSADTRGGGVCNLLGVQQGRNACGTSSGLAPLVFRSKLNYLDQTYGPPVSASIGIELRYGIYTAPDRDRLTALGEGTFDTGLTAAIGRSSGLAGGGYYYTFLEAVARYRWPNTTLLDHAAPGSEFAIDGDFVVVPKKFGFGPTINFFDRPSGVDWDETDLTDKDRFAVLRVINGQVGAKFSLAATTRSSLSLSVLRTVYAENNPLITSVGIGVNFSDVLRTQHGETPEE